eukprot:6716777-Alexandrium_andersonii.AAC.1
MGGTTSRYQVYSPAAALPASAHCTPAPRPLRGPAGAPAACSLRGILVWVGRLRAARVYSQAAASLACAHCAVVPGPLLA